MGIFKRLTNWNQDNRQKLGSWIKSLPSKAGGVYKKAVLQPQIDMNKELADYSYSKNLEMWNLQNEYNSPASQRQRMEEAGFNPNYMASGGASSTGSASPASMPQYNVQAPQYDPMSFYQRVIGAANGILSLRQGMANIRKTESQTGKLGEETKFLDDTQGVRKGNLWQQQSTAYAQERLATQLHIQRGGYKDGETITDYAQPDGLFHKQRTATDVEIENKRAQLWWNQNRNHLMSTYGINTSDNPWFRMGFKALDTIGIDPTQWLKSGASGLSNYLGTKRGR